MGPSISTIIGIQKEVILAARRSIVTVEEVVTELAPVPGAVVIPGWVITAVAEAPGGARPSYAHGYYDRDNTSYKEWDFISRDRDRFIAWMGENVLKAVPTG
jgi:glutaconate CoA-transferase, subunit A